ncbi:hypothetical protein FOZ63_016815 [Perkinsus olseni]|uniref:CCHC-type domain-containing protein n=1 Tax=Perkinsus olseni TaxID=32597 RepID=A0A7J6SR00_PEROL|nr:hypothetical protein FOZ63_016815 [Perkinsus olseni]
MTGSTSVGVTQTSHGAPSGNDHQHGSFSQLVRDAALASSSSSLSTSPFTTVAELNSLSPAKVVEIVSGISSHSVVLNNLYFVSREGKKIGLSLKAFSESWGVTPHRDSYFDRSLVDEIPRRNNRRSFYDYDFLERCINLALSQAVGETAMVRLYIYAAFMPKPIAEYIKAILINSISENGVVKAKADCLAWRDILLLDQEYTPDQDSTEIGMKIRHLYDQWCKGYATILKEVKVRIDEHQEVEQPQARNPVLLLHQWSGLPDKVTQGRLSYTRFSELEKLLFYKVTSHSCKVSIDWNLRRLLYVTVLKRSSLFRDGNSAVISMIERISLMEDGSPDRIDEEVMKSSNKAGYYNVDRFLNLQRRERPLNDDDEMPTKQSRSDTNNNVRDIPSGRSFYSMDKVNKSKQVEQRLPTTDSKNDRKVRAPPKSMQCYNCGELGHFAYKCPYKSTRMKTVSLRSNSELKENRLSDAAPSNPEIGKESSAETPDGDAEPEVAWAMSHSLLTADLKVGVPGTSHSRFSLQRIALDTMSSTNLCTSSVVSSLGAPIENNNSTLYGLHSSSKPGSSTSLEVLVPGKKPVVLRFLVIEDDMLQNISGCAILIGNASLPSIGVEVSLPKVEFGGKGGVDAALPDLKEIALSVLCENVDVTKPLPGAPAYQGRLRRCLPDEVHDTAEQKYVYEVVVPRDEGEPTSSLTDPHDYSIDLYHRLATSHKEQFLQEIKNFVSKHYLSTYKLAWQSELRPGCVTFPVVQGLHKSTKCRPCTDARKINLHLPVSSYDGYSVSTILAMVRARFRPGDQLVFMDLEKAFLRLRHADSLVVKVLTLGKVYYSSRVLFGLKYGPCALSGFVLLLLDATFSSLLGYHVRAKSTTEFANLLEGLTVVAFYDDILILGRPELVQKTVQILSYLAPVIGGNFPREKVDHLSPSTENVRHLGVNWRMDHQRGLIISCIPPQKATEEYVSDITRRRAFAIAGSYFDPLQLHPYARLGADWLRHWAGQSPGGMKKSGWDRRWTLSPSTKVEYLKTIEFMNSDNLGNCSHGTIDPKATHLVVHCDASNSGYGFTIHAMGSQPVSWKKPNDGTILQKVSGSFNLKKRSDSWHINRKELYSLATAVREAHNWINKFHPCDIPIKGLVVFTDNTTAANWATEENVNVASRSYDRIAIERLQSQLVDMRDDLKHRFGIPLQVLYIKGTENELADELSRKAQSLPALGGLGVPSPTHTPTLVSDQNHNDKYKSLHDTVLLVTTDQIDSPNCRDDSCLGLSEDPSPTTVAHETSSAKPALAGLGNLSKDDILSETTDVLLNDELTKNIFILNIKHLKKPRIWR